MVEKALAKEKKPGSDLTPRKRRYCEYYVTTGGKQKEAGRLAGYAEDSASRSAWRLMQEPAVLQYIQHLSLAVLAGSAPGALSVIKELSAGGKSEYVRLEASKDLLDRAGMRAPEQKDVHLSGGVTISIDLSD